MRLPGLRLAKAWYRKGHEPDDHHPDDFAVVLGATPEERERRAREALALELYREGKISSVAGTHLTRMDLVSFQGLLMEHGIPRNYSVKDLHDDLAALDRLLGA